jgi:hypothetical protein
MYLRVVRTAGGKGVKHEYVRIVEAYRENGKNKHRTVINLGRKDLDPRQTQSVAARLRSVD